MTTICVVDLSNIFWTAFMSTSDSDPASAAHDRTVGKIRRIAEDFPRIGIACDHRENWRRTRWPLYKAQRAERPPQAWAQLEHTMETLRREGYPVWQVAGYEADDIMATVAAQAPTQGHGVCLVTADKDLRACIRDPAVYVMTPGDSRAQPVKITEANCGMDKQLVPPRLVRDYIALRGDGSDNLPGVKGIGPVKALRLLLGDEKGFKGCGSFPGVVAAFEQRVSWLMDTAEGKALLAILDAGTDRERMGIDDAHLTWELAELRKDAPVDWIEALHDRVMAPVPVATDIGRGRFEDAETEPVGLGPPVPMGEPAKPQTQALAVIPTEWRLQCEPSSFDEMWDTAKMLANSRAFPALKNPEQACAAMMLGRAHGIPAIIAAMNCYPVKDRMSMSAGLIVGLCLRRTDTCEYLEWSEGDDQSCTWVAKRVGRPEKRITFTLEQAKRAGYTTTRDGGVMGKDGMYHKDAETMLSARASTRAARRVFPDIVSGLYSAEEMNDVE